MIKKNVIIVVTFFLLNIIYSQDNRSVSLIVNGQGQTMEDAKQNAFRNAIEQASSEYFLLNKEIPKSNFIENQVITVSSGYIKSFEIISELKMSNGSYNLTLIATVSLTSLSTYYNNKGFEVEYSGSMYAANLKNIKLNKTNESQVINQLKPSIFNSIKDIFSYKIRSSSPNFINDESYKIELNIQSVPNKNFEKLISFLKNSFSGLSLTKAERKVYKEMNIPYFKLKKYFFRNRSSVDFFYEILDKIELEAKKGSINNLEINSDLKNKIKSRLSSDDNIYSALNCLDGNLSKIKINKFSLLDRKVQFKLTLDELSTVKSFSMKNGIINNDKIISAEKFCKTIQQKNIILNYIGSYALIFGLVYLGGLGG